MLNPGGEFRVAKTHVEGETQMKDLLMRLWKEEEGQDLTEYALLLTLIALACLAAMNGLAAAICKVFGNASTQLS
jgi:pilus assembly protein Flp/PilA